jgi:DNA-binding CsgD family transcriptional regulator
MIAVDAIVDSAVAGPHIGGDPTAPFDLSPREVEVLRLIAQGRTDQETADLLSVSRRTVHTHVASILNKLAAENRTAAVATAVRFGLA